MTIEVRVCSLMRQNPVGISGIVEEPTFLQKSQLLKVFLFSQQNTHGLTTVLMLTAVFFFEDKLQK